MTYDLDGFLINVPSTTEQIETNLPKSILNLIETPLTYYFQNSTMSVKIFKFKIIKENVSLNISEFSKEMASEELKKINILDYKLNIADHSGISEYNTNFQFQDTIGKQELIDILTIMIIS
ncbi:MAG: hypothetical protein HC831_04970 [Chloroflexia bacterium]|nr:hypothetical protein [Chloroflexia bacterium]